MNDEKYDQLKQIIQAANPEIMELKFGCRVYIEPDEGSPFYSMITQGWGLPDKLYQILGSLNEYREEDFTEILGRYISLADVFIAMKTNLPRGKFIHYRDSLIADIPTCWKFKDDNLDHQSDETKQFLAELLTNETNTVQSVGDQ